MFESKNKYFGRNVFLNSVIFDGEKKYTDPADLLGSRINEYNDKKFEYD